MLVESPKTPMTRMYFRSPQRVNKDTTYVFPRGPHNGVVLGGVRLDNEWNGDVDLEFAEDIKRRCCALAPELGKPEDLKVIYHGVGLRREFDSSGGSDVEADSATASRKGGARLERERFGERLVVHNYGAGGAGYQASWYVKRKVSLYLANCILGVWPRKPSICCRRQLGYEHDYPSHVGSSIHTNTRELKPSCSRPSREMPAPRLKAFET